MTLRTLALTLALCLSTSIALAHPPAKGAEAPCMDKKPAKTSLLDKLKPLAGTWLHKDGTVGVESRLTSGGSVLLETMVPGTPHEMVNAFHQDGDALVLTHYCAMGNQPRMVASAEKAPGVLVFTLRDATNVDVKTGAYMGQLTLTIVDADHIVQEWQSFKAGKVDGEVHRIELVRKRDAGH